MESDNHLLESKLETYVKNSVIIPLYINAKSKGAI